tara:strand:- start:113 stop:412 length:300 start_codon:yes stop_codon:yes gene_type:complete
MSLTKTTEQDQLEVVGPYKAIGIQEKIVIKENDSVISETTHRRMLNSGDIDDNDNFVDTNISSESADVQALCNIFWTTDIKNAWKAYLIANKPKIEDNN